MMCNKIISKIITTDELFTLHFFRFALHLIICEIVYMLLLLLKPFSSQKIWVTLITLIITWLHENIIIYIYIYIYIYLGSKRSFMHVLLKRMAHSLFIIFLCVFSYLCMNVWCENTRKKIINNECDILFNKTCIYIYICVYQSCILIWNVFNKRSVAILLGSSEC